ncbi:hypothetical protein BVI2075_1250011 [Burkholderia vietnamiensis]|nr:hypothetical protein BVI2075_1250011 [Burkholderia vietnamiensis]
MTAPTYPQRSGRSGICFDAYRTTLHVLPNHTFKCLASRICWLSHHTAGSTKYSAFEMLI